MTWAELLNMATVAPITGVAAGGVQPAPRTPAYMATNPQEQSLDSSPNANLSVFANPVEGFTDTGVAHDGDLGGAG